MSKCAPLYCCEECGVDLGVVPASELYLCVECFEITLGAVLSRPLLEEADCA
jgi:hypothetical protein